MTLTREGRSGMAILLAIAVGLTMFVWGNQRHASAQTLAEEILCGMNEDQDHPIPTFNVDCEDDGGGEEPPPPPPPPDDDNNGGGDDNGGNNGGGDDDNGNGGGGNSDNGEFEGPENKSGGGSSKKARSATNEGEVLGAEMCSQYLTAFLRTGASNDTSQVLRLQYVLHFLEGHDLEMTGVYDTATLVAVNAFQQKYADEVLTPWGLTSPTGYTYLTTRKKVNEVYCKGMNFPLTEGEQQIIDTARTQPTQSQSVQTVKVTKPASTASAAAAASAASAIGSSVTLPTTQPATTTPEGSWWERLWGWVRGGR